MALLFQVSTYNETALHPVGVAATLVLGLLVILVPRSYSTLPVLGMACLLTAGQRLVLFGLDFNLLRLILLFGMARVLLRGETAGFVWKPIDTLIVTWAAVGGIIYCTLHGDLAAVVYRLGRAYDSLGMYFFFRCVIRQWKDVDQTIKSTMVLVVPVLIAFSYERATQRNPFSILGGVPEFTVLREGRLRCQGPFAHPILAGCFWAALIPLMATRWWKGRVYRSEAFICVSCCLAVIVLSASSTPLGGVLAAGVGAFAWYLREKMRVLRWSILIGLTALHFIKEQPIWHLLHRVDFAGGSTGWYRYKLIDKTITNFGEWWLQGVKSTRHWGEGLNDLTNQYVLEGVRGGVLALVLFLVVIGVSFAGVGRAWRQYPGEPYKLALCWGLGISLFVQATMFLAIAITYAQQNLIVWYFTLASIAGIAPARVKARHGYARVRAMLQGNPAS